MGANKGNRDVEQPGAREEAISSGPRRHFSTAAVGGSTCRGQQLRTVREGLGPLAAVLQAVCTRQRLAILAALADGPLTVQGLRRVVPACGTPLDSSLHGLELAGLVYRGPDPHPESVWALTDRGIDPRCGRAVWMALRGLT